MIYEYAGFLYLVETEGGEIKLTPVVDQHPAAGRWEAEASNGSQGMLSGRPRQPIVAPLLSCRERLYIG